MIATKPDRILVPTDFSDGAAQALRYASDLARSLGAHLTVLYSDSFLPPVDYTATVGGWDEYIFMQLRVRAEEQLRRDAEANIDRSVPYDIKIRVAAPLDGILTLARESGAGLIVMGTHGRTGFRRLLLGSVTEGVMRRAEVPVIAVPPRGAATSSIKTIVCPVLCDAQGLAALEFAAQIAPPEARFIVIRATPADDVVQAVDDLIELRAWIPDAIAARCELRLFGDEHVAEQIEAFSKSVHADLIVAGESAGRTGADALYGTFAARLVQQSACPVLTVNRTAWPVVLPIAQEDVRTRVAWASA